MYRIILWFTLFLIFAGCGKQGLDYGPYSIGRDDTWFPLELGPRSALLTAFTDALVQEIASTEGVPLQIVDIPWGQLFEALDNEIVAGVFSTLCPNKITLEKFNFSSPILLLGPVLVVRSDSTITSLADLNDEKIVAVNQFDESVLVAQRYPLLFIELYSNESEVLTKLAKNEIDGVLMPVLDAERLLPALYPGQLKIVTQPLNNKALRLITLKNSHRSLMTNFNRGLKKALQSSRYTTLKKNFSVS